MNTHRMSYQILTSVPSGSIRKNVRSACLSHERRRGGTNAKLGTHQTRQFAILRTRRASVTQVAASKGFGYGSGTQKVQSIPKDYVKVGDLASLEGRQSKVVVFGELKFILFNVGGQVFCTEANSTAYKYPLIDAQLTKDESSDQIVIETPLDGTTYNLETGEVIEWCPKNNFLRNILGAMKEKEKPIPLKVYPVVLASDGSIHISKVAKQSE